jgi:putative transposase
MGWLRCVGCLLGVARSGYYAWVHKPLSDRALEGKRLLRLIRDSYQASGTIYGSPRILLDLREIGVCCGKHRVLMRTDKIKAIRGYKIPHHPGGRPSLVAPDKLQRAFTVEQADAAWVTDLTYIRTWPSSSICFRAKSSAGP